MPLKALRSHPQLYEINTWPWLDRLSAALGRLVTLGSVPDSEWDKLQQLGFDVVYFMGVWTRSPIGRELARSIPALFTEYDAALPGWTIEDVVGSAFSVQAYQPDPHIGTPSELISVRRKLHARGIRLLMDFVPNHTGLDHRWVQEHPDYYIQGAAEDFKRAPQDFYRSEGKDSVRFFAHGRDPYFPPWTDTAQLNCFNPQLRQAMLSELGRIAQFCDGIRCDMAMLLLNDIFASTWAGKLQQWPTPKQEFWQEAIAYMPDFLWLAESYWGTEARLQQLGFHFTYDKVFYDRLRDNAVPDLKRHLQGDPMDFQGRSARFLENHDEARSAQAFGSARLPAVAALMATLPGMHFYYEGQLDGRKIKIPVQLARAQQEVPDPRTRALYEKIFSIVNSAAFHEGLWTYLEVQPAGDGSHINLIAYTWRHRAGDYLVVVNLGAGVSTGRIFLPASMLVAANLDFYDELNGPAYARSKSDLIQNGLFVKLDGNAAHIFRIAADAIKPDI